jgi:hypothetical protein
MIATGIIPEGAPIELIEGYLVAKDRGRGPGMAHGEPHALAVSSTYETLFVAVAPKWVVRSQLPITLGALEVPGGSAPEPDAVVARGPRTRYTDHHPGPKEVRLAVEVSGSTLAYDRSVKGRLYALAGIPVYWIVNLVDRRLEVYTRPNSLAGRYPAHKSLAGRTSCAPVAQGPSAHVPGERFLALTLGVCEPNDDRAEGPKPPPPPGCGPVLLRSGLQPGITKTRTRRGMKWRPGSYSGYRSIT